jgi:hypothetical protein
LCTGFLDRAWVAEGRILPVVLALYENQRTLISALCLLQQCRSRRIRSWAMLVKPASPPLIC